MGDADAGGSRWQQRFDQAAKRHVDFTTLSGLEVDPVYGPPPGAVVPGMDPATRHEDHVGTGRGAIQNARVIRQDLPHFRTGEAIADCCRRLRVFPGVRPGRAPVTSGPPLPAKAVPALRS